MHATLVILRVLSNNKIFCIINPLGYAHTKRSLARRWQASLQVAVAIHVIPIVVRKQKAGMAGRRAVQEGSRSTDALLPQLSRQYAANCCTRRVCLLLATMDVEQLIAEVFQRIIVIIIFMSLNI